MNDKLANLIYQLSTSPEDKIKDYEAYYNNIQKNIAASQPHGSDVVTVDASSSIPKAPTLLDQARALIPFRTIEPVPVDRSKDKNLLQRVIEKLTPKKKEAVTPTPSPTPGNVLGAEATPEQTLREQTMKEFANQYNMPVATLAAQIAGDTSKYDIFNKYPYLPLVQSILESSGLKKFIERPGEVNRPKQALGWGMYVDSYNPQTVEQVFKDYMSGIGGRSAAEGFTPEQIQTSESYKKFRETGNFEDLAAVYAPSSDNPETGGSVYAQNIRQWMDKILEKESQIKSRQAKNK